MAPLAILKLWYTKSNLPRSITYYTYTIEFSRVWGKWCEDRRILECTGIFTYRIIQLTEHSVWNSIPDSKWRYRLNSVTLGRKRIRWTHESYCVVYYTKFSTRRLQEIIIDCYMLLHWSNFYVVNFHSDHSLQLEKNL